MTLTHGTYDPDDDSTKTPERGYDGGVTYTGETIDITPTWAALVGFHIGVLTGDIKIQREHRVQVREDAKAELVRMARIADMQVARSKHDDAAVVIVTRHSDEDNGYRVFGEPVWTVDVDLGHADLRDPDEYAEWAESHNNEADRLALAGWPEAAEHLREIVRANDPEEES